MKKLHEMNPEYEFVWFVNDMNKKFPQYVKKFLIHCGAGRIGFQDQACGLIITENHLAHVSVKDSIILM